MTIWYLGFWVVDDLGLDSRSVCDLIVFWAILCSIEPNRDLWSRRIMEPSPLVDPTWLTVCCGMVILSSDELERDLESVR